MTKSARLNTYAWYCTTCKKFDVASEKEALATPEHVPHRGIDIGECKGEMIPLYSKVDLRQLIEGEKKFLKPNDSNATLLIIAIENKIIDDTLKLFQ